VVLILMDVHAAIKSVPAWVVKPIYLLREALRLVFPIPIDWVDAATSLSSRGSAYVDDD